MNRFRNSLRAAALFLIVAVAWQMPAQASDPFDDFVWVLKELDKVHANPFPLSGQGFEEAEGLVNCLMNVGGNPDEVDLQTIGCIQQFQNTELAGKIPGTSDLPSWLDNMLSMYIALRAEDYWGAVKYVSGAAVCILAQYFTGGQLDICGLVKELVEIAKGLLNAGVAIGKFIADLGEGTWEGIKAIGCSLGLGGCSSGKSTPAHEIVYTYIFAPVVKSKGLPAIENNDATQFGKLRAVL